MRATRLAGVVIVIVSFVGVIEVASTPFATSATLDPVGEFFAVSCVGSSYCLAAGTAVASWNGQTWQELPRPKSPHGTLQEFMNAVSCPAVDNCVVVGSFETRNAVLTLADRWNGHQWSSLATGATTHANFEGVSCPTTTWCVAGGGIYSGGASGTYRAVAGTWLGTAGGSWTVTPLPPITGASTKLGTLVCASDTVCVANAGSVIDTWNGQSWSNVATSPYDVGEASCQPGDSVADCIYLGLFASGGKYFSDTLQNVNGHWQLVGASSGSSPISGDTAAYSCSPSTSCFAVGQQPAHANGADVTFTERWNGEVWRKVASPSPNPAHHGMQYDAFFGVSCVAANNCTAVGRANNDVLAEQWNGTRWQVGAFR